MGKYRIATKNKYSLPREDYLTALHYSLRYPLWLEELKTAADTGKGIRYDLDKVQTTNDHDITSEVALRMVEVSGKINLIDDVIKLCSKGMDDWLRKGVCYGLTFDQLKAKGMPCERKYYYQMRRMYYFELMQRI
jgi:hypothetical protein